ncbi:unnamed protein product [Rotaria sordida]|uniref:Uncharacterized protein n=1 Tax=Rotaria sordida TaxID=392033 RepID=A0A815LRN4_9BILA|nr:unnamed protein product [Rotaria sordida]
MKSVATERVDKLEKQSFNNLTRHDLKRDAAVLKDMINRITPQPSTAPPTTFDENKNQLRKFPFTPWPLFRKSVSPIPSLPHQSSS